MGRDLDVLFGICSVLSDTGTPSGILSDILSDIYTGILSRSRSGGAHCDLALVVQVELEGGGKKKEEEETLIRSNNLTWQVGKPIG